MELLLDELSRHLDIDGNGVALVFCQTTEQVDETTAALRTSFGTSTVERMHSADMPEPERQRVLQRLAATNEKSDRWVLCASEVTNDK